MALCVTPMRVCLRQVLPSVVRVSRSRSSVRVLAHGAVGATELKKTGFIGEMRAVAMKLHTKDQAPQEGGQKASSKPMSTVSAGCRAACSGQQSNYARGCSTQINLQQSYLQHHASMIVSTQLFERALSGGWFDRPVGHLGSSSPGSG